jgi:hypothetical protein
MRRHGQMREGTGQAMLVGKAQRVRRVPDKNREAGMKEVTELLEQGLKYLDKAYDANNDEDSDVVMGYLNIVEVSIKTALEHIRDIENGFSAAPKLF